MRMRITDAELDFYSSAKRDNRLVFVQRRNWRVAGVTADMMGGAATGKLQSGNKPVPQWWVELSEVR
jgi:hypothetical protein